MNTFARIEYVCTVGFTFLIKSISLRLLASPFDQGFKVFVEFSADEHGLNCGLDFRAEVCETFFHLIHRDMIFKMV